MKSSSDLTRSGQVIGTPSYMPPEQATARSGAITPASDVYSLGAILYSLLTGRPPFQSAELLETLRQVCETDPIPPSRLVQSTPRDLETIALHCLEKRPEHRFASASDLSSELQLFLDGRPILTRPVGTLERILRWSRRQPLVASLLAAVMSTVVVGTMTISYLLIQERQGRRRLEQSLYRSQVMQANLEWQAGNIGRADLILDACNLSQRNWEWRFLKQQCHVERLELSSIDARVRQITYNPRRGISLN